MRHETGDLRPNNHVGPEGTDLRQPLHVLVRRAKHVGDRVAVGGFKPRHDNAHTPTTRATALAAQAFAAANAVLNVVLGRMTVASLTGSGM